MQRTQKTLLLIATGAIFFMQSCTQLDTKTIYLNNKEKITNGRLTAFAVLCKGTPCPQGLADTPIHLKTINFYPNSPDENISSFSVTLPDACNAKGYTCKVLTALCLFPSLEGLKKSDAPCLPSNVVIRSQGSNNRECSQEDAKTKTIDLDCAQKKGKQIVRVKLK